MMQNYVKNAQDFINSIHFHPMFSLSISTKKSNLLDGEITMGATPFFVRFQKSPAAAPGLADASCAMADVAKVTDCSVVL